MGGGGGGRGDSREGTCPAPVKTDPLEGSTLRNRSTLEANSGKAQFPVVYVCPYPPTKGITLSRHYVHKTIL